MRRRGERRSDARLGGLQVFENLAHAEPFDAGEEVHLYGESDEDVFFIQQSHVAGRLTKLLAPTALLHRFDHAIHVGSAHRLQLNQDFAYLPSFLHGWFALSQRIHRFLPAPHGDGCTVWNNSLILIPRPKEMR
jgi:hypothetical protein